MLRLRLFLQAAFSGGCEAIYAKWLEIYCRGFEDEAGDYVAAVRSELKAGRAMSRRQECAVHAGHRTEQRHPIWTERPQTHSYLKNFGVAQHGDQSKGL